MSFKKLGAWMCMLFATGLTVTEVGTRKLSASVRGEVPQSSSDIQFITAEELKAKLARNDAVTIIDVRAPSGDNDNKIRGAVHVKLRRLSYRLAFPPLKGVPRDRDVVTYCACPNDESAVRAAEVLIASGFKRVRVLKGGWVVWKKVNGQVESGL